MRELQQVLIDGKDPSEQLDSRVAATEATLAAMNAGPVAEFPTVKANASKAVQYARIKWAGSLQQTNASGVWTCTLPAGLMETGVAVVGPVIRGASGYDVGAVVTGSVAAGYQVTLTFTKRKSQITLPAVVIGAAAVNLSLNETSPGVVTFDVAFAEPDVIG